MGKTVLPMQGHLGSKYIGKAGLPMQGHLSRKYMGENRVANERDI